jgi:hypothetical protein
MILWPMARRPDLNPNEAPLTPAELKNFREHLAKLSPHHVSIEYQRVYMDCRMFGKELPSPKAIQQLVQIYKQLWKWRES